MIHEKLKKKSKFHESELTKTTRGFKNFDFSNGHLKSKIFFYEGFFLDFQNSLLKGVNSFSLKCTIKFYLKKKISKLDQNIRQRKLDL